MFNMSVVEVIKHYQRSIEKCQDNKDRVLHCIGKLYRLPVTVQHLQDTGIGRTVNALRKYDGDTGEAAKALVAKWKAMVAAEDSSDGEEHPDPEENNNSPEEEQQQSHRQSEQEHHRSSKDKSSHRKKYREEKSAKVKKKSIQDESRKRRYEEENGKSAEKKRRKQETDSDSSDEDRFQVVEPDDSGHDSDANQVSQDSGEETTPVHHGKEREKDSSEETTPVYHSKEREKDRHHRKHEKHKDKASSSSSHKEDRTKTKEGSKHRKDEKRKVESKKHKSKSAHSAPEPAPKIVSSDKKPVKVKKEKPDEAEDGSIDCSTGASFAEALGMVDPIVKKKHISTPSPGTSSSASSPRKSSSSLKKKDISSGSSSSSSKATILANELGLLSPNVKLEPLEVEVDLAATLPAITPNYKPLPHYNLLDSPPHRKTKHLTEEEALSQVMSTKNQRTKVYSGVKSGKSWATVPSLYDICVRVLQENIDALEYTGGVPYDLLKPVLQHATPEQLFMLEHYNPYLIEDTGDLWQFHCQREFRSKQRQDMETAREMYIRCLDEREAKLKALTTNIQQSIAKSTPVRQTKLAYVDSIAKPPRNVARQQAKFGTAHGDKLTPAQVKTARAKAKAGATAGAVPAPAPVRHIQTVTKAKPRMAPLMQKTMKLVKSFKR
ncbi:transcription elongation factor B polypeptide 3 isoform X2 [Periplaneta americana]|uniref:transcription elongation factor B polypeptide 3 isoform X2 n=1 Tax=Periplaneta americana TaxID=6978 RepID=UPI0037E722BC